MPIINITLGKGQATGEQKKDLINSLTENAVRITALPEQAFTILINELPHDNIGIGGRSLSELKKNDS